MAPSRTSLVPVYKLVLDTEVPEIVKEYGRVMPTKIRLADGRLVNHGCSKYEYFLNHNEAIQNLNAHIQIRTALCIQRIADQQALMDRLNRALTEPEGT